MSRLPEHVVTSRPMGTRWDRTGVLSGHDLRAGGVVIVTDERARARVRALAGTGMA